MKNLDLIIKCKDFAIYNHNKIIQKYDIGLPYYTHLQEVVDYVHKFEYLLNNDDEIDLAICSAWGHDLIEDTNLTYNKIKNYLNQDIAEIIFLLTNHRGRNRNERANDDYYQQIKNNKIALFVKICDRIANTVHSYKYKNMRMYNMYDNEYKDFKSKLYDGNFDDMWYLLENIKNINFNTKVYFPKIEFFDEINIFNIKLPKPIPFDLFNELYNKGIIAKKDLEKNKYYFGKCRQTNVALWNGFEFVYIRTKFNEKFIDTINHIEDDNGYDLFIPLKLTTPTEEQVIKY